ncbi:thioredoxin domain-containing protein [Flavihumibacter fluvii]|uniref:thioredoxin domain-containing protein n=1 Tax=Flavihumibacter fluvii TaxID=2838157 RepID=UPI001BDF45B2|nr:thioredoxin domain-containing protein [Flavihumibacter fluvii]ULQ53849.1 thioredoxin domain-containing protein [Flavihumibacter fluvii]
MKKICTLISMVILVMSCRLSGQSNFQLSPEAFEQKARETGVQILDVRTPEEFKSGYIAGALQANWYEPKEFADRTQHLDPKKPILIYCASGVRSGEAAKMLRTKGFTVYELTGGLNKYKKEGRAIVTDQPVKQLSEADFEKLTTSSSTVLVDFGAAWCPPCRKMEPVLAELQQELPNQFALQKLDGGVQIDLMKSLNVDALPHFLVYKNGVKTWEKQGIVSLDELKKAIQ